METCGFHTSADEPEAWQEFKNPVSANLTPTTGSGKSMKKGRNDTQGNAGIMVVVNPQFFQEAK